MDEQIKILNETFRANEEIELIEEFRFEIGYFYGCIQLSAVPKESLIFDIKVPHSYPLLDFGMKSIKFICKNAKGFLHMNEDNSICLITPQSYDFKERLSFEIHELKLWRDKYYIREERDDKYDYLIIPNQNQMTFLFTDIASQFIKNDFGMFEAVKFNQNNNVTNYYITKIGKDQCELSNSILKEEVILNGLYYFIEDEPINYGNICFNNWQQFNLASLK
jgi:hypothetical protein